MRIVVVEDDLAIQRLLQRALTAQGHQISAARSGEDGVELAADDAVELAVLDISLPDIDGHEVLRRIRARRPALPVLMLTARDDLSQKVKALDGGADDYLTKPFALDELLARIRALTRRADQPVGGRLTVGSVTLDLLSRRAWRGDALIELSSREFELLHYFMRHPDQVLSRSQILGSVWEYDYDPESNVVDVYVRYLRNKLSPHDEPSPIVTLRGAGYRFDPSVG